MSVGQFVAMVAIWVVGGDEGSRIVSTFEGLVVHYTLAKADVVCHALDNVLVKRIVDQIHCFFAVFAPSDKL